MNQQQVLPDLIPSAQLWIGSPQTITIETVSFLRNFFCTSRSQASEKVESGDGCLQCTQCLALNERQHNALLWLHPSESYTLDYLQHIFDVTSFARDTETPFFFVLQSADRLGLSCANALLKLIEEPPLGYHFILLAERLDAIAPTIRSRCHTRYFKATSTMGAADEKLLKHFGGFYNPALFLKDLEEMQPSEYESLMLVDRLLTRAGASDTKGYGRMVDIVSKALLFPPMPGSGKIFLRNLYLAVHTHYDPPEE